MSSLLQSLHLAPARGSAYSHLSGLVSVKDDSLGPKTTAERTAREAARLLEGKDLTKNIPLDFIFFRRFADGRSPQVAAYVLDNSKKSYNGTQIAELHYRVWLNGIAPLLYVEWPTRVDILRCASSPDFWNPNPSDDKDFYRYHPHDTIKIASEISRVLDEVKIKRYSAYRLSDGTFWENPENAEWTCADKAAHNRLIQAVVEADKRLKGASRPLMRRLLLLFILVKYLEDRGVFPNDQENWFSQFQDGATCFLDLLAKANVIAVKAMLTQLKKKFNGDLFDLSDLDDGLTAGTLREFHHFLEAKTLKEQRYLWGQYSFNYIPVEVLSHLYQHFAQEGHGAVFTPPLVVDLMLDYAMPYESITGRETIFDPTCGSGIFLVGAFRRLVHHWKEHNGWEKPLAVEELQVILKRAIFGAELEKESAHIAAFNLALAVCDALQPEIIWNKLRFDKLIGTNIVIGDVFENLEKIRLAAGDGFSIILGNPPFKSKLTEAAVETRHSKKKSIPIPDQQISYRVLEEAMNFLATDGRICMLQVYGFLYNAETAKFRENFIVSNTVETVLDFVSIRNLFESADTKAVAILAHRNSPSPDHVITHLTFRKTKSTYDRICFELDHYDAHAVTQMTAEQYPEVWKANLLGGGRLVSLALKMSDLPSISEYWDRQGWTYGEGYIVGNENQFADWLTGKAFLPTFALNENGIDMSQLQIVTQTKFEAPRKIANYTPPMILIKELESLPMAFWGKEDEPLAFLNSILSINASPDDEDNLIKHYEALIRNKKKLRALCLLKSSRALVGKSTSILAKDIKELPWTNQPSGLKLSWWEQILLDDIVEHIKQLIQIGPKASVYKKSVGKKEFDKYADTFTKLLGTVYTNLKPGKNGTMGGLAYQAFYLGENSLLDWPDDWNEKLSRVVHQNNSAIYTTRVIRFYESNTLIIVKPELLRYWIPSTAIWDSDETLIDMQQQGF